MGHLRYLLFFLILTCFSSAHADPTPESFLVTIHPLYALTSMITVNTDPQPELLLKNTDDDPHHFHMHPVLWHHLMQTKTIFFISPNFEQFVPKMFLSLHFPVHFAYPVAEALSLKPSDNLHIWLNPQFSEEILTYITDKLSNLYSHNQEKYHANLTQSIAILKNIDHSIARKMSHFHGRTDIIFFAIHDAYAPFFQHYGLQKNYLSTDHDIDDELSISPLTIRSIQRAIDENKRVVILTDSPHKQRAEKIKQAINSEKVSVRELDPLGYHLSSLPPHKIYPKFMQYISETIVAIFSET